MRCGRRGVRHHTTHYPELKGGSLVLYVEAYGEENYPYYIEEFDKNSLSLVGRSVTFRKIPVHDARWGISYLDPHRISHWCRTIGSPGS